MDRGIVRLGILPMLALPAVRRRIVRNAREEAVNER
jgi:hypothetical protein